MSRLASLMALLLTLALPGAATAQHDDGEIAFNAHCRKCHSVRNGDNRLGPSVYGIFGAKAGQVEGFRGYSGSLTDITWDEPTLDKFIANPASISPNTNMIYPPVTDPSERKRIIEFIKSLKGQ